MSRREVDGEAVRVVASSRVEVDGATRVECMDGLLWLVKTEPVSAETPPQAPDRA